MTGCLFVGGTSIFCRESHLHDIFQKYGKVVRAEIKKCQEEFKFQGYGFVTMETVEEAENAMNGLNGYLFKGRKLRINWASSPDNLKEEACASVAFSFISRQLEFIVCEETLAEVFSHYGCEVVDVRMKQFRIEANKGQHSGVGFAQFPLTPEGVLAAKKVIDHLANVCFKQIMFDSNMSTNLMVILKERPELDVEFTPLNDEGGTRGALKHKRNALSIKLAFELPFTTVAECEHLIDHTPKEVVTSVVTPPTTPKGSAKPKPVLHANRRYNPSAAATIKYNEYGEVVEHEYDYKPMPVMPYIISRKNQQQQQQNVPQQQQSVQMMAQIRQGAFGGPGPHGPIQQLPQPPQPPLVPELTIEEIEEQIRAQELTLQAMQIKQQQMTLDRLRHKQQQLLSSQQQQQGPVPGAQMIRQPYAFNPHGPYPGTGSSGGSGFQQPPEQRQVQQNPPAPLLIAPTLTIPPVPLFVSAVSAAPSSAALTVTSVEWHSGQKVSTPPAHSVFVTPRVHIPVITKTHADSDSEGEGEGDQDVVKQQSRLAGGGSSSSVRQVSPPLQQVTQRTSLPPQQQQLAPPYIQQKHQQYSNPNRFPPPPQWQQQQQQHQVYPQQQQQPQQRFPAANQAFQQRPHQQHQQHQQQQQQRFNNNCQQQHARDVAYRQQQKFINSFESFSGSLTPSQKTIQQQQQQQAMHRRSILEEQKRTQQQGQHHPRQMHPHPQLSSGRANSMPQPVYRNVSPEQQSEPHNAFKEGLSSPTSSQLQPHSTSQIISKTWPSSPSMAGSNAGLLSSQLSPFDLRQRMMTTLGEEDSELSLDHMEADPTDSSTHHWSDLLLG